ncbi:MAG: cupredoxin domain-containing protein [Gammaproteobacteria bacterium]|nr:cupredoxin domain-containing protein [Gammaproteobacteria bacterium]
MVRMSPSLLCGMLLALAAGARAGGEPVEITIRDYAFQPAAITVPAGTTVRWVNREKRQYHSVWFEALGEPEPDYIFPGESFERGFDAPGEFPYRCGPHPEMRGMVTVTE